MSRHVPHRVRVRLARKRNEDEDSPNKLYTLVTYVNVTNFKGQCEVPDEDLFMFCLLNYYNESAIYNWLFVFNCNSLINRIELFSVVTVLWFTLKWQNNLHLITVQANQLIQR
jgi:hypothetical protein